MFLEMLPNNNIKRNTFACPIFDKTGSFFNRNLQEHIFFTFKMVLQIINSLSMRMNQLKYRIRQIINKIIETNVNTPVVWSLSNSKTCLRIKLKIPEIIAIGIHIRNMSKRTPHIADTKSGLCFVTT